ERSTSTSFLYDPFNPKLSEGLSDNDVTHRFVGDLTYRLPFGFQVSGIASYRTGVPYTAGIAFTGVGSAATSLNGLSQTTGNIPVYVDANGYIIDLTQANGMTRAQFQDFLGARGAHIIGRNTFREPKVFNVDLRLSKVFGLPGGIRLEVLGEAFNLVNQKNRFVSATNQQYFGATYTAATDTLSFSRNNNFGLANSYLSTSDPRQYQVAAKFIF
ncbi:MAG: hypothetical protein JWN02_575, partial [Acidobacteria bacterium]|nr:hypothetical protein [Acidobacteriota bacterium]